MKRSRFMGLLLLTLLLPLLLPFAASPLHAQDNASDWRLVEARDLTDELFARLYTLHPEYVRADGKTPGRWYMLTLAPDGTRIAFSSDRDGDLEIFSMSAALFTW